ncbi:MAG TPA: peptide deformylase [Candidatus Omnitrophota bacterium]|nr:peptide deformylase [Candidatus Omnitrophota bacterium]HRZ14161.1 peptide deformylase [Candidatus Omnitrophota bacterium]
MNETELKIRTIGDPVLRKKTKPVKQVTAEHKRMLSLMSRLMYESSGIGLAAPQVGLDISMIVVDIGKGLYKLINPRIVKKEGRQAIEEGCLSCPGISVKVKRAKKVTVQALDEDGRPVVVDAENMLACVMQHEIDHLLGKLIVDYVPMWKKALLGKKIKNL